MYIAVVVCTIAVGCCCCCYLLLVVAVAAVVVELLPLVVAVAAVVVVLLLLVVAVAAAVVVLLLLVVSLLLLLPFPGVLAVAAAAAGLTHPVAVHPAQPHFFSSPVQAYRRVPPLSQTLMDLKRRLLYCDRVNQAAKVRLV